MRQETVKNQNRTIAWTILVALVIGSVALLFYKNDWRLAIYKVHMRENWPDVQMRYAELSRDMDEAAVQRHFAGIKLRCYSEPGYSLGERVCATDVNKVDGLPALNISLFLRQGKLAYTLVQVPWWRHAAWLDGLTAKYGRPVRDGVSLEYGGPVLQWNLPNATLEFNGTRGFNPLAWSIVFVSLKEAKTAP